MNKIIVQRSAEQDDYVILTQGNLKTILHSADVDFLVGTKESEIFWNNMKAGLTYTFYVEAQPQKGSEHDSK